jgi:hypothetical protein
MSEEFRAGLNDCLNPPGRAVPMSGRGIVTCAGGERYFTNVYVLVRILRETLRCALPMQLWHFGGEEISPAMRCLLAPFDVELVDVTSFLSDFPANIRNGWQLKSYALLHSRFEEVLFLDADQVPVRDPAFLFDCPEYCSTGAVFWPDITDLNAQNPIWALTGLPAHSCPSWESGQILVDKRRHIVPLRAALYLNEQAHLVYRMLHGDKDTFLIAWRIAGASVAICPHRPFIDDRILVQRDFNGAPLFQHRTNAKWSYHGNQYHLEGFIHMQECLTFLGELRRSWNGRRFFPPDRSGAACAEEERLVEVRKMRLVLLGEREIDVELLPGHQIGDGRTGDRQNWFVVESDTEMELIFHDGDRLTHRLRRVENGSWQGEKISSPPTELRLIERPSAPSRPGVPTGNGLVEAIVAASGVASGAGTSAREGLIIALRLIVRAAPGLRDAIKSVANGSPLLAEVVDQALAGSASDVVAPVAPDLSVLDTGYQPFDGPKL